MLKEPMLPNFQTIKTLAKFGLVDSTYQVDNARLEEMLSAGKDAPVYEDLKRVIDSHSLDRLDIERLGNLLEDWGSARDIGNRMQDAQDFEDDCGTFEEVDNWRKRMEEVVSEARQLIDQAFSLLGDL